MCFILQIYKQNFAKQSVYTFCSEKEMWSGEGKVDCTQHHMSPTSSPFHILYTLHSDLINIQRTKITYYFCLSHIMLQNRV